MHDAMNIINDIAYAKKCYDDQVEKVKREEYISRVLKGNWVGMVRQNLSRYDCIHETIRKASGQFNEKYKKNRQELEMVKDLLVEDFFNNDPKFKLNEIIRCGYESYGWEMRCEGYGQKFNIFIPCRNNISIANIDYAHEGMFAFIIYMSDAVVRTLKTSYNAKDIGAFIKGYFEEAGE